MARQNETVELAQTQAITDEALATAALSGDESAFEQIFQRHWRRVARIAGRFFSRPEKVEEIVQEVFTKLYFALGDYSRDRGSTFIAWLSRIAVNSCYDQLRQLQRRREESIGAINEQDFQRFTEQLRGELTTNNESNFISRDLAQKLLARLSPEDRLILTLLVAEEFSINEIAQLLRCSESKVKVRAHRARLSLRNILHEFL
jgi:RNA polymerase sigma-70 factor (ECF subfamily)